MESTWPTRRDSATERAELAVSRGTKVYESNQNDLVGAESKDISRLSRVTADATLGSDRVRLGADSILGPIDIGGSTVARPIRHAGWNWAKAGGIKKRPMSSDFHCPRNTNHPQRGERGAPTRPLPAP